MISLLERNKIESHEPVTGPDQVFHTPFYPLPNAEFSLSGGPG
jgi:hypothetical protein